MSYIKPNFLLENKTAFKLYYLFAKEMPIFDYHCHLSEYAIYEDKEFENIFQAWLSGDHYKWRLMRNYGVDENLITGNAPDKEKFAAYCSTLSRAFGNPLYHWSQIELKEFFDCDIEINEKNADRIWNACNSYIRKKHLCPSMIISKCKVKAIFTTNEIFDDLEAFDAIAKKHYPFIVAPAFRADKIMNIEAALYNEYIAKLGKFKSLNELESKVEERLTDFIKVGCVASDIALEKVEAVPERSLAEKVFAKRMDGNDLTNEEIAIFKGYFTYFLLGLYTKYNIRSELHIGAKRNNNSKMLQKLGLDSGFDSISDANSITNLSALLDKLNNENKLPPMILFNLNPKMNAEMMTLAGCFQDSAYKGKIQYGAAWWFLDNKVGMERHLDDLTATGHIGSFIGMLTDSRSFLSYPRHQYFRRVLCNYLGNMMEKGQMTNDFFFVGSVIKDICFNNVAKYFGVKFEE